MRIKGHALHTEANRGGLIAECSCGELLKPEGRKGQSGRLVGLNIFTGPHARAAIREAHEAHKLSVKVGA